MRITGSQVGPVAQANLEKVKKLDKSASTKAAPIADRVDLSRDMKAITTARKVISTTADFRQEKVEALRREIQEGTYKVDSVKVADRILAEGRLSKLGRS